MFSFSNVIHIIIIFQGALLTFYILISSKKNFKSDYLLAAIIGTLSIQILGLFLTNRNIGGDLFQSINCIFGFLYGPLLFLYSRSVTRAYFRIKPSDYLHFLPAIVVLVGVLFTAGGICQSKIYIAYAVHILSYVFLCFLEVRSYKKIVKDNYSRLEWLNLGWLQWTFFMFFLIVSVDVIQVALFFLNLDSFRIDNVVYLLILATINLLYFKGFFSHSESVGINKEDLDLSSLESSRMRLDLALKENQQLISNLEKHLSSTESFKNPHLTISKLSQELEIPKRTLSELINDHYAQNFVNFINTRRIDSAMKRLMNPKSPNETILEVLYEVGFNSKSSFNTAFKKKTGMTPSEFKSKNQ